MDLWTIVWLAGIPPAIVLFALCGLYDWRKGGWKERRYIEPLDWISGAINSCFLALAWPGFLIAGVAALMLVPIHKTPDGIRWARRRADAWRKKRQLAKSE